MGEPYTKKDLAGGKPKNIAFFYRVLGTRFSPQDVFRLFLLALNESGTLVFSLCNEVRTE